MTKELLAKRILVTGGTGFVGRRLVERLAHNGGDVTVACRTATDCAGSGARIVGVGEVGPTTNWAHALDGQDIVVHLAGAVPASGVSREKMIEVNDRGTARLALQCRQAGVGRLVSLSSILAMTGNSAGITVDDDAAPAPDSAYGASKLAGERHVEEYANYGGTGISLRPPLVYAAHARGNWASLQRLAASGLPLPFAGVNNRRSLISLESLVDATIAAITEPDAPSGSYCVEEGGAVSLAQIIGCLRRGMGTVPRLFSCPDMALRLLLRFAGYGPATPSLLGDLQVSGTRFKESFAWVAKQETVQGLTDCGSDLARSRKGLKPVITSKQEELS
jgi:UDP-glucose 4-epimerase